MVQSFQKDVGRDVDKDKIVPPRRKRWLIAPRVSSLVVARFPQLNPLLVQILVNRGITTPEQAEAFLVPDKMIHNPLELYQMSRVVDRLRRAIRAGEPVAVYGDFDVDGVTATVLLVQTLLSLGARVKPYIPHRIDEGYGLNHEALKQLQDQGVRVVITVDCGVRSLDEVAFGKKLGLDVIVTDHHAPGDELPDAFAVINPKQVGCKYPSKELSGVGIAYKLAQALLLVESRVPLNPKREVISEEVLLDLVALGTVADLVPLTGENRAFVRRGLEQLRRSERPGIQAMLRQAAVRLESIDAGMIGYTLGPRLNAAGRLESALKAFDLLSTQYPGEADKLAQELEETNRERQRLTMDMTDRARKMCASSQDEHLIFVTSEDFPEGIVGLIASRLSEEFYRPAIAIHCGAEESRGSARSIGEFNIVEALDSCKDILVRHGGHAMAAGFTVRTEYLGEFERRLRQLANKALADVNLAPVINIDAEARLGDMTWQFQKEIEQLAPFGFGNREPLFASRHLTVRDARVVGTEHLKLMISDGQVVWDAIGFRQGSWLAALPRLIDVAYQLEVRTFNGDTRLQLHIKDLLPSGDRAEE